MILSKTQQEIINHKEGALLVMASAGSGKTKVLTERIKKILEEEGGSFHVLALTFTNKAAKEMKERLENVEGITKRAFIGTIHGFCQEIIEKQGYAIGLNEVPQIFEKNEDRISILIQVFEKVGNEDLRKFYTEKNPKEQEKFIYNALSYISLKKKNLKGIKKFDVLDKDIDNSNIQKMYDEYNDLLKEQNAMDFDDVIIYAYDIFAKRPSIAKIYRKLYKYISIDEAQDLNFAQYEFLKILCNGEQKNVLMVGDSNQSLYHFNGSDKKIMEQDFVTDFGAVLKKLNINYRSSKVIVNVANTIKPNSIDGFETDINGRFEIIGCDNEELEAIWVTDKIQNLLKTKIYKEANIQDDITEQNIAILARNRYLFKYIESEFSKRNIRYFIKKNSEGMNLESSLLKIFDLGLRILINPYDQLHFLEIISLLNIDVKIDHKNFDNGIDKLKNLLDFVPLDWTIRYSTLINSWLILSDLQHLRFRDSLNVIEEYAKNLDDIEREMVLFDVAQYRELWGIYAKNTNSELKSLQHFKTQIALGLISPTLDETGITLSTVHLSKGLEYKVVFIIGMTDGAFPDYRAKNIGGQALEEEKNAFYVAVTRAERILNISYPQNRFMPWDVTVPKKQNPSIYLSELESLQIQF